MVIPFEILKKIILKAPEYWATKQTGLSLNAIGNGITNSSASSGGMSELVSSVFTFKDFFKAFKVRNSTLNLVDHSKAWSEELRRDDISKILEADHMASKTTRYLHHKEPAKPCDVQEHL